MIRYIIIALSILSDIGHAQDRVYFTTSTELADADVIFVNNKTTADIVVNQVAHEQDLRRYKNSWYVTKWRSEATLILRPVKTTNGNRRAVRVYVNDPPTTSISGQLIYEYRSFKSRIN
jgi:hypothetical protein